MRQFRGYSPRKVRGTRGYTHPVRTESPEAESVLGSWVYSREGTLAATGDTTGKRKMGSSTQNSFHISPSNPPPVSPMGWFYLEINIQGNLKTFSEIQKKTEMGRVGKDLKVIDSWWTQILNCKVSRVERRLGKKTSWRILTDKGSLSCIKLAEKLSRRPTKSKWEQPSQI